MVRIQRILCPVDFSPASLRAAQYAIELAQRYAAQLHLLHIVSPILYTAELHPYTVSEVIDSLKRQSVRDMKRLERRARAADVTVYGDIRTGDIRHEIDSAIRATKADIVVMGSHGRRGLKKWFLGSVTEGMLRRSPVPVITLRGSNKSRTISTAPRILVTTDFSKGTGNALDYALSIADATGARVTFLHVLEEMRALTSEKYREKAQERITRELLKLVPLDARSRLDIQVEAGTPSHLILRTLKKEKIDLLVMNTHGKGIVDRVILGSTSERVVRAADCAVMLIPPLKAAKSGQRSQKRAA
jgi:nucleotide-binding universal stress UspA family protein